MPRSASGGQTCCWGEKRQGSEEVASSRIPRVQSAACSSAATSASALVAYACL